MFSDHKCEVYICLKLLRLLLLPFVALINTSIKGITLIIYTEMLVGLHFTCQILLPAFNLCKIPE